MTNRPRIGNTIAAKMKLLRSFFRAQDFIGEVAKTPFHMMDGSRRKAMMREKYDTPVSLSKEELKKIIGAEVPELMSEVRDIFVLHCYIGCRVNDLKSMTWDNVSVADGVPYIHYMPQKTALQQEDELATPLMQTALEILKKYDFKFPLLRLTGRHLSSKCITPASTSPVWSKSPSAATRWASRWLRDGGRWHGT